MTSNPRFRRPTMRSATRVAFSVDPLDDGQRVLTVGQVDAEGDHPAVVIDHERDQVRPVERGGQQLGQRRLGRRHEPPGHRRLARRAGGGLDRSADRLQTGPIMPRRQPGQHPGRRQLTKHLGAADQLIRRHRQLPGPVDGPHPRPLDRHPPAADGARPGLGAVPVADPIRVVLVPRAHTALTDSSISTCITCLPVPTANASSSSRTDPVISPSAISPQSVPAPQRWPAGSCPRASSGRSYSRRSPSSRCSWRSPEPYQTARLKWGTATSSSTRAGTSPVRKQSAVGSETVANDRHRSTTFAQFT